MIEQIAVVLCIGVLQILGIIYGRHLLWKELRENEHIIRKGWCYTATEVEQGQ